MCKGVKGRYETVVVKVGSNLVGCIFVYILVLYQEAGRRNDGISWYCFRSEGLGEVMVAHRWMRFCILRRRACSTASPRREGGSPSAELGVVCTAEDLPPPIRIVE